MITKLAIMIMTKKIFITPTTRVLHIQPAGIIASSGDDSKIIPLYNDEISDRSKIW